MGATLGHDLDTAAELLEFARARRAAADAAERGVLLAAAEWAAFHHADGIPDRPHAQVMYADHEVELAGEGAPGMQEFAIAEFAAALGMSTDAGRNLLGDALELRHRLPAVWARIFDGSDQSPAVPAWKARMVAQRTKQWSPQVAAHVDRKAAPLVHRLGPIQLGRMVEEAIALFDVDNGVRDSAVERFVRITPNGRSEGVHTTATVEAVLDLADAMALEQAVAETAHALLTNEEDIRPLDERRAAALGRLADGGERHLQLYVHLGTPELAEAHLARAERMGLVTEEEVAGWCDAARRAGRVTVTPVLDLNADHHRNGYAPSAVMREQAVLVDETCAFPWCNRPARHSDLDHIEPYDSGGATASSNLAALCRRHHRLKTHTGWTYERIRPGTYRWRSPHGLGFERDRTGTAPL